MRGTLIHGSRIRRGTDNILMKKGRTAKCPRRVALPNCSLPAPPQGAFHPSGYNQASPPKNSLPAERRSRGGRDKVGGVYLPLGGVTPSSALAHAVAELPGVGGVVPRPTITTAQSVHGDLSFSFDEERDAGRGRSRHRAGRNFPDIFPVIFPLSRALSRRTSYTHRTYRRPTRPTPIEDPGFPAALDIPEKMKTAPAGGHFWRSNPRDVLSFLTGCLIGIAKLRKLLCFCK